MPANANDHHHDDQKSLQKMQKNFIKKILTRNAVINIYIDWLCHCIIVFDVQMCWKYRFIDIILIWKKEINIVIFINKSINIIIIIISNLLDKQVLLFNNGNSRVWIRCIINRILWNEWGNNNNDDDTNTNTNTNDIYRLGWQSYSNRNGN